MFLAITKKHPVGHFGCKNHVKEGVMSKEEIRVLRKFKISNNSGTIPDNMKYTYFSLQETVEVKESRVSNNEDKRNKYQIEVSFVLEKLYRRIV